MFALAGVVHCGSTDRSYAGGPGFAPATTDASTCGGTRCSKDLHQILDGCTSAVVTTCAPEQGCANGACVDACASAEANLGSVGCAFVTVPPAIDPDTGGLGSCYALAVTNTWDTPVDIAVEYGGVAQPSTGAVVIPHANGAAVTYEPLVGSLPPGEAALVFMSGLNLVAAQHINCPDGITPIVPSPTSPQGTTRFKAFHVTTTAPVSVYSIFPYGGAASYTPSATVLYPARAGNTNYMIAGSSPREAFGSGDAVGNTPFVQLIANQDETHVSVRQTVASAAGDGVEAGQAGVTRTLTLQRGEGVQVLQTAELAGSVIDSDKGISVFSGNNCMFIGEKCCCDTSSQQLPPLAAWGTEYAAVSYPARNNDPNGELVPWRILAAVDGTRLTYDPPMAAAPTTLDGGKDQTFWTNSRFVVTSQDEQHPIYVAGYMTGGGQGPGAQALPNDVLYNYGGLGDPEYVNVIPAVQYLSDYVFFVDPTYAESALVLVRPKAAASPVDVKLDCAGVVTGWTALGARYEYALVPITHHFQPVLYPGGSCGPGRRTMTSDQPFGVTVWGYDRFASYAYPAGAGARPVTPVHIEVH